MNYLAIDTSGKNLTILIKKDQEVFKYSDPNCGVQHSVELMPRVEELLVKANFDLKDADFLSCVVGAGSFTGIRIGVATVKAMCFAYSKPCLAITSFDTLAYNEKGGKVLALIDAKHNGFYACGYDNGKVVLEPSYLMREQIENLIDDYDVAVAIAPIDGLNVKSVCIGEGLKNAIENKLSEISNDPEKLSPLYVRKSQAEEGR